MPDPLTAAALGGFAFLAGLVDAVAGGGGLIQLPALLLFLPASDAASLAAVFGTNKLSSICGTGMAVAQYARRVPLPQNPLLPAAAAALVFSFLGARAVSLLQPEILKPLILVLLVAVAAWSFAKKDFGRHHEPRLEGSRERRAGLLLGAVIGFYDGFFGPGTGTFLIFAFVGWFGFDFLTASASAKVVNLATNVAAIAYFAATDNVLYRFGVPMAACNVAGSLVGTRLALLKGNRFVRLLFQAVIGVLIARFGWEVLRR